MGLRGHIGKILQSFATAALCLLLPGRLQAATSEGLAAPSTSGTYNLSASSTWTPTGVPTNGNNVFINFTAGANGSGKNFAYFTNAPANVFVADSLNITNSVGGNQSGTLTVTFSGAAFFTSGVAQVNFAGGPAANADTTALTFNSNVTFGAMNFIGNSASGNKATLTLAGTSLGNSLLFTAPTGSGNNFLIVSGNLGLTGTLTATNINSTSFGTISGDSTVSRVVLNNTTDGAFTIASSTLSITGATASVAGGFTVASDGTIALSGGGGLIISNIAPLINGTLNIGNQTVTGKTNWSNDGTVLLAGGFIVGNNLTNNSDGALVGSGSLSNIFVNLGTVLTTNGTLTFVSNLVQGGTMTIGGGSTISMRGPNALTNYGTINLLGAAGAGNNAVLDLGTLAITNKSGGTITGGGVIQNSSQVVNLSGGSIVATSTVVELQFTNANTVGNAGTIGAATGATLTFGTAGAGSAIITNFGTINLTGGTLLSGNITNLATGFLGGNGNVSSPVINSGIVNANGGELELSGAASGAGTYRAVAGGTLTFMGGGSISTLFNTNGTVQLESTVTNTAVFANQGTVVLAGGTYQTTANVTNAAGKLIINSGAGTINAANVYNLGTILTTNATVTISNLTQGGTLTIGSGGTLNISGPLGLTNFGTINLVGAAGAGNNAVLNLGSMVITNKSGGTITGGGIIQNSSQVINLSGGTILATSTVVELQFTNASTVGNGGTIGAATGATLTFGTAGVGSAIITNFGTINLTGGTLNSGDVSNLASGFLGGTGTINAQVINQGRVNLAATIDSNYLQTAGSFTVNGSGTITGTTTINGGTLDLAGGQLTNGLLIIGSGGTLTNGVQNATLNGGITNAGLVDLFRDTFINGPLTNTGTWIQRGAISNDVVNSGTMTLLTNSINLRVTGSIVNSGSLTFDTNGVIYVSGVVSNSGSFSFGDVISNNLVNTAGSITLNGSGTVTGTTTINGGTLDLNGKRLTNGLLVVNGTGVVTNNVAGATVNGGVSNDNVMGFTANTFFNGPVTNTGTFAFMGAVSNTLANSGNVILNNSGTVSTLVNNGSVNVNNGTLSLLTAPTQNGSITVANGATINAAQAWVNNGTITLLGGSITNAAVTNNLFISGFGTIDGSGVVNNGKLFADASSISGVGTETVRIASFTNNVNATIGTASSNAVLNLLTTGNTLINRGTVSLSGGTIIFNGGAGTITNFNIIAGVGNVANFPIVNAGTLASFVAQAPISGLSNLIATIGVTNNGLLGANNFINGAATLSLTVSGGGAAIVNHGTVALQGGFLTINGGAGTITNISNGLIYGVGTQKLQVANLAGGTIMASNGIFSLGLQSNANAGVLSNLNAASTILLTNKFLVNNGTVVLNGGGLVLSGSVITNEGLILGPGAFSSSVYNDTTGLISATNGVLNVATNLGETVSNLGQMTISSDGTLNVVPDWLNTNGTVSIFGGDLTGGVVTNIGTVSGFGTISSQVVNQGGGTLTATGAGSLTLVDAPTQGGWVNIGNGATLNVLQSWLNSGTVNMQGGSLVGSTVTNAGSITGFGTITPLVRNNGGATFTVTGGTMTLAIAPTQIGTFVITNGGTLNVLAAWQNSGTVNMLGGDIIGSTVTNAGTITGFGGVQNLVNNGSVFVTNGTLRATASFTQNSTVNIAANSRLDVTPAWSNNGSVLINGGFISGGTMNNTASALLRGFGTVSNAVANLGTIVATNGTLNLVNTLSQSGTITVANAATFNMTQAWQNNGLVNVQGGTVVGGALTNAANISGSGTIGSTLVNNSGATITALGGGTLNLTSIPVQNGTVNILGTLNVASAWSNNSGGSVKLGGGVLAGSPVANLGTMSGNGTISAALSNTGYLRATNGFLNVQTLAGNQAAGILEASAGATLALNGTTAWSNNGQLTLAGGTVIGGDISNNATHLITGVGSVNVNVYNNGEILANNSSQVLTLNNSLVNLVGGVVTANTGNLVVSGTFTNAGTLNMVHSVGTFSGGVVNSGAWITDPTINVFQNTYTVTSSGYIQSSPGDVYIFSNNATTASSFINLSTNKNRFDTLNGDFVFANTLGATQQFAVAGHDFGPGAASSTNMVPTTVPPLTLAAYSNNFALGTLQISDSTTVEVTDAFSLLGPGTNDGQDAALYLDNLYIGSNSLLLIAGNVQLYFINSNNWSMANIELEGNPGLDNSINGIHQFAVIPEPSVVLLWLCGFATIDGARRRWKNIGRNFQS